MGDAVTTATNRNKHAATLEGSASLQWTSWRTASRTAHEGVPLNNVGRAPWGYGETTLPSTQVQFAGHAARRGDRYPDDRDGGAEEGHHRTSERGTSGTYQDGTNFALLFQIALAKGPLASVFMIVRNGNSCLDTRADLPSRTCAHLRRRRGANLTHFSDVKVRVGRHP